MLDARNDFAAKKLEESVQEAQALRDMLRASTEQLHYCEDMLRFYANPHSYRVGEKQGESTFQDRLTADYEDAANTTKTKLAGARARLYFKSYDRSISE